MLKVSFKETENNPCKVISKVGRTTDVVLRGIVKLPSFWHMMPPHICEWIAQQPKVELHEKKCSKNDTMIVYSKGTARCNKEDKYNTLIGERLAEARAKTYIYGFFYELCCKLYDYYSELLFGKEKAAVVGTDNCIERLINKYEKLYYKEQEHQKELITGKKDG